MGTKCTQYYHVVDSSFITSLLKTCAIKSLTIEIFFRNFKKSLIFCEAKETSIRAGNWRFEVHYDHS